MAGHTGGKKEPKFRHCHHLLQLWKEGRHLKVLLPEPSEAAITCQPEVDKVKIVRTSTYDDDDDAVAYDDDNTIAPICEGGC